MTGGPALVWFDSDLRLGDNPALAGAMARHSAVLPVFIQAPDEAGQWRPGTASRWWLHRSLQELQSSLKRRGSDLIVRRGPTVEALVALAAESGARAVYWNRRYEPWAIERERSVADGLRESGIAGESRGGNLLFEPGTVLNAARKPFQVFTSFWRACLAMAAPTEPLAAPQRIPAPEKWPSSVDVASLGLVADGRLNASGAVEPATWRGDDWDPGAAGRAAAKPPERRESPGADGGFPGEWQPGEEGASRRLAAFVEAALQSYPEDRNRPDRPGTSRLSPHLHFGEISVRQVWSAVLGADRKRAADHGPTEAFLRQLAWREFSHHLLFHFPQTAQEPLRSEFRRFPWRKDAAAFEAWTQGKTGYPVVDAGMRQLGETGWMHNRVRMLAASFLVKHLLIPWQAGAAWFHDTLVDADLANNTMGWQWTAGCGADAAPYFRIFNPVLQGEKFDPDGSYVRRWVPELANLPAEFIHRPWEAPGLVLAGAGVELGTDYPRPVVEHEAARERALAALASMRARRGKDSNS